MRERKKEMRNGEYRYQCSICKHFLEKKYYHKNKNSKDGYTSACFICRKKRYYYKIREHKKTCNHCLKEKSLDDFHKSGMSIKSHRRYYASYCKECRREFRNTESYKYSACKRGAKKRGIEFSITIELFKKLIREECAYCGSKELFNGIDRKNSSLGYTKENSVSCCRRCNMSKHTSSPEEFLEHCKKIYLHKKSLLPSGKNTLGEGSE